MLRKLVIRPDIIFRKSEKTNSLPFSVCIFITILLILIFIKTPFGFGKKYFNIKEKSISSALKSFAIQSDSEILFTPRVLTRGEKAKCLIGYYSDSEALKIILSGTGLKHVKTETNIFLIVGETYKTED